MMIRWNRYGMAKDREAARTDREDGENMTTLHWIIRRGFPLLMLVALLAGCAKNGEETGDTGMNTTLCNPGATSSR